MFRADYKISGWQGDRLKRRVTEILTDYAKALDDQLKEEIKAPQFSWPGPTRRKNGTLVTSPRDIVDTGAFLRSQRRERISPTEVRFTWGNETVVSYAGIILRGKGSSYPSRNWIKPALEAVPLEQFFARAWAQRSGR